jgi:hypothetical protein
MGDSMSIRTFAVLACITPLSGCHLFTNIARNAYNEPAEIHDEYKVVRQLRREGKAAFGEVKRQYPRHSFSHDFENGFIDGYQDYLDNGGKAEVPAMPPLHYRRAKFLNPEGHARIRDYFLGFKYGVDVAVATGCRPFYTVPILVGETGELPPLNIAVLPPPPAENAPMPKLGSPLPLPQEVKPGTGMPLTPTPGLGNPVTPMPGGSSVPIPPGAVPTPNPPAGTPVPKAPLPEKPTPDVPPGGKSTRANGTTPGEFVTVTSVDIPAVPQPVEKGPILTVPPPAAPLYDVPPPRPTNR